MSTDRYNAAYAAACDAPYARTMQPTLRNPTPKHTAAQTASERACVGMQIRLDMSEYSDMHTVSRLIGSPPGYIGYGEVG